MDLKQLPPATPRPPFLAGDLTVFEHFEFRVLHQNRRLARSADQAHQRSLEEFHEILEAIARGTATPAVRKFLIEAYVRGARMNQDTVPFEGPTACVTKRRYRDRWNTAVLKRSAKVHRREQRVKAVFIARGTQNQYLRHTAAAEIRRAVRTQATTTLRLAGHWLGDPPVPGERLPHCMRAMLVANFDVPHAFANGSLGRVVHWGPEVVEAGRPRRQRTLLANVPGVQVRFYKESAFQSLSLIHI